MTNRILNILMNFIYKIMIVIKNLFNYPNNSELIDNSDLIDKQIEIMDQKIQYIETRLLPLNYSDIEEQTYINVIDKFSKKSDSLFKKRDLESINKFIAELDEFIKKNNL